MPRSRASGRQGLRWTRPALAQAQKDLDQTQKDLGQATAEVRERSAQLQTLEQRRAHAQAAAAAEQTNLATAEARVRSALADVQAKHNAEVAENEKALAATAKEDRSREEQFRREVAAAHEDPDTYAPGVVDSQDPVQQCSISVIGEGEIQLRGPIKGLNVIRTMINQIDAPVGQVRIAIHTAQVNGEHGDRMERVVARIQRYIDHSRFLTAQSGQMLRKAVVVVASRKAEEALASCPPGSQASRDQKYLFAFFGEDFIRELETLESEFLKTGNKLLALHSMDSTSLSAALFLLALAKNSTRHEILEEFGRMIVNDLPMAEMSYFQAAGPDKDCKKFPLLGYNARFQSLRGFFDAEVRTDETMTPIQREFVKLAQIFKSRLVTELELQQRILERTIIEERLGNYLEELQKARNKEQQAQAALEDVQRQMQAQQVGVLTATATVDRVVEGVLADPNRVRDLEIVTRLEVDAALDDAISELGRLAGLGGPEKQRAAIADIVERWRKELRRSSSTEVAFSDRFANFKNELISKLAKDFGYNKEEQESLFDAPVPTSSVIKRTRIAYTVKPSGQVQFGNPSAEAFVLSYVEDLLRQAVEVRNSLAQFQLDGPDQQQLARADRLLEAVGKPVPGAAFDNLARLRDAFRIFKEVSEHILPVAQEIAREHHDLMSKLSRRDPDIPGVYAQWLILRLQFLKYVRGELQVLAQSLVGTVDEGFRKLLEANVRRQLAQANLEESRRPLDHKKLLDMLIDQVEDKYIELLEGTRAHTANIDNYIKAVSTALDDDFQTQFYLPAFRGVREASRLWDVQLGKIETTSILTNNRAFGKVTPSATMEFDLPKRDILIAEAMNGSLAMMQTYGGLLQDPAFLALTKLNSGQPTSSQVQGAGGGLSEVRSVLPGLPSSTDERILSQSGPGERRFASPLEGLIPDPAIYKFETGTGYEIRPVISPDGQSVVFHFNYMYTTDVREPVRADEKHLGRVKRHFIDTDVQLGNYELREISKYIVALKASRTSRGVPLLEDIPGVGILFRPLPSAESSLQQNVIMGQATIFPTLFDLMGLRWAPAVADLDSLRLRNSEFVVRMRRRDLENRVFDFATSRVDEFLRVPPAERRSDLYRTQETIPYLHPNGYRGPGLNLRDGTLREGYDPRQFHPEPRFVPGASPEGVPQSAVPGMTPGGAVFGDPALVPPGGPIMVPPSGPHYLPGPAPAFSPPPGTRLHDGGFPGGAPGGNGIEQLPQPRLDAPGAQGQAPAGRGPGYRPSSSAAPPAGDRPAPVPPVPSDKRPPSLPPPEASAPAGKPADGPMLLPFRRTSGR